MISLRRREIYHSATLKLIVVERVEIRQDHDSRYHQIYCKLEPTALIVYGTEGVFALDMNARPVDVDGLGKEIG
jgi:hypothetical protein